MKRLKNIYQKDLQYYPADQVTDHPERFIISELIREKVLHLTREEIPHSIAVVIEKIEREEERRRYDPCTWQQLSSTVIRKKELSSVKKVHLLKEIGTRARKDIEMLLGSKVFLELWVKVQKDWRNKPGHLKEFGFRDDEY